MIILRNKIAKFISLIQLSILRLISGKNLLTYIDIGASGFQKPLIAYPFKNLKLIAFEPDPRKNNFIKKHSFDIHFYPYAISGSQGLQKLFLTEKPHCSSLKNPILGNDKRYKVEKIIEVKCETIDNLNIKADALKIDAQGAELDILKSTIKTLSSIEVVEVEAWLSKKYHKQAEIYEINEFLKSQGFIFVGFSALYFENSFKKLDGGVSFGDMLFIKNKLSTSNQKIIFSSLISGGFDNFILKLNSFKKLSIFSKFIVVIVLFIGLFKPQAPKIY